MKTFLRWDEEAEEEAEEDLSENEFSREAWRGCIRFGLNCFALLSLLCGVYCVAAVYDYCEYAARSSKYFVHDHDPVHNAISIIWSQIWERVVFALTLFVFAFVCRRLYLQIEADFGGGNINIDHAPALPKFLPLPCLPEKVLPKSFGNFIQRTWREAVQKLATSSSSRAVAQVLLSSSRSCSTCSTSRNKRRQYDSNTSSSSKRYSKYWCCCCCVCRLRRRRRTSSHGRKYLCGGGAKKTSSEITTRSAQRSSSSSRKSRRKPGGCWVFFFSGRNGGGSGSRGGEEVVERLALEEEEEEVFDVVVGTIVGKVGKWWG